MALTRQQISQLYRPTGPKIIQQGLLWSSGGKQLIGNGAVDLSVPLEGFRFVFKMRDVIAGANMTSANPSGYLNMITRFVISGKNSRQGGNVVLWDMDLTSLAFSQAAITRKPFIYNGVTSAGAASSGTELVDPSISSPVTGFLNGTTGTYDIRIVVDVPAYPFGVLPALSIGYILRNQEWKDSLQIRFEFPTITNGATHALGTDNASTTHTFSGYGGGGSPTLDVYGLPILMGLDLDAAHAPGFVTRIATPISTVLQSAGGINTNILTAEKQDTHRVFVLIGTSTVTPSFATLSDTNLTTLGMIIGGNRVVRENDDIFAHKLDQVRRYGTMPIQGLTVLDFDPSGNPDAAYDASQASEGATIQLRGSIAGVANAFGIIIQEAERFAPAGSLYAA